MPQLFCVLEEGGRALLTRAQGDVQTPSFPTVGLLSSIATYTQNSGHELRVIASTNVRVVYRRFDNHLLFVLITSNLLLQTELLQLHLETLSDALLLLLGSAALVLDTSAKIDGLKKKLRATSVLRSMDSLIADDTLVPCILLPVPQMLGLALRDKATLQVCLTKMAGALGCQHAALVTEGHYLAATHGWWALLSPREQMLVQHLAAQLAQDQSGDAPSELLLHVGKRRHEAPLRLKWLSLSEGVLLVVMYEASSPPPPPLQGLEQSLRAHLHNAAHILDTPLWLSPPVPQFSSITFDLALVVEHSPPSTTLLWGHSGSVLQQGFNPLMSRTLRKQMGSSASPMLARMSYKPPSAHREEPLAAGGDGLQLFYRSAVDTLVSFVLQTWPQMPQALRASLHGPAARRAGARVEMPGQPKSGGAAMPSSAQHPQQTHQQAQPPTPGRASGGGGGAPASSRLGLSTASPAAVRRLSSSSPSSPVASVSRLQTLFGRGSTTSTAPPPAEALSGGPAGTAGTAGGGEAGVPVDQQEPSELDDMAYEEVHAVIDGARLLALLDRSGHGGAGWVGPNPGGPNAGPGGADSEVDVFMVFPRRVGRLAALEAAMTLRSTYMMSYHGDYVL